MQNLPEVPPFNPMELAKQEAEALGLYVRHDPLQEHRKTLQRMTSAASDEIEGLPDGERVVIGGIVEKLEKKRLKDKRQMGILSVLDHAGMCEAIMWPEELEKYTELLESDEVLLMTGAISHRRGTSVMVDKAFPISKASSSLIRSIAVTIACDKGNGKVWEDVHNIINDHHGATPVLFDLQADGLTLRCQKGAGRGVKASELLARKIEECTGEDTVRFEIQPPPGNGNGKGRRRRNGARSRR